MEQMREAPARRERAPRQERGRRRVDALLDAAAALVVEEGPEGVTMHGVAKRARTAIGSLYHFFPDREALLRALGDRHARTLEALADTLRATSQAEWARLSTAEAVRRFVEPFLDYLARRPDLLRLMRAAGPAARAERDPALDRALVSLATCVVGARCPRLGDDERLARAAVLLAMLEGVVALVARSDGAARAPLTAELQRALAAYLDACASSPS